MSPCRKLFKWAMFTSMSGICPKRLFFSIRCWGSIEWGRMTRSESVLSRREVTTTISDSISGRTGALHLRRKIAFDCGISRSSCPIKKRLKLSWPG